MPHRLAQFHQFATASLLLRSAFSSFSFSSPFSASSSTFATPPICANPSTFSSIPRPAFAASFAVTSSITSPGSGAPLGPNVVNIAAATSYSSSSSLSWSRLVHHHRPILSSSTIISSKTQHSLLPLSSSSSSSSFFSSSSVSSGSYISSCSLSPPPHHHNRTPPIVASRCGISSSFLVRDNRCGFGTELRDNSGGFDGKREVRQHHRGAGGLSGGRAVEHQPVHDGFSWVNRGRGGGRGREEKGGVTMEEEGARRKPRVVIIGAGMAGIAAAQRLQKAGARYELTILEASHRIGGRICSSEFNGEGIELGATYIHGIEGSPVFSKAVEIGAMENAERAWEGKDGFLDNEVLKAEGGLEVPKKLVEPAVELYKHMVLDLQEMGDVQPKEMVAAVGGARCAAAIDASSSPLDKFSDLCGNYSLGAYLDQGLDRFLVRQPDQYSCHQNSLLANGYPHAANGVVVKEDSTQKGGCPRWSTRYLQECTFRMHGNLERTITAADDLNDIDIVDFHEYWEFPGAHRTIAKGYSSVVRALASQLPPGVVQFGQNVERIVWSDDDDCPPGALPVRIHCQGGSVVEADHVIVTVSLGVLKALTLGGISVAHSNGGGHSAFPSKTCPAAEVERKKEVKTGENGHTEGENGANGTNGSPAPSLKVQEVKTGENGHTEGENGANGTNGAPAPSLKAPAVKTGENGHTEGENGANSTNGAPAPSLKAPELFYPPLPMWKLESISKLGFGVVDKVFVQIEPAEKGSQHRPVQFIFHPPNTTTTTGVGEKKKQCMGLDTTIPAWMRKTFSLYPIHRNSHVLLAWFAGQEALQVESLTDEQIMDGISKTLTGFGIPEDRQGAFLDVKRSKWGQNPLFRGSYSYVKVGSTGNDIDTLAEPLPRRSPAGGDGVAVGRGKNIVLKGPPLQLLFAGEATHRHCYSTTHGAYFSGLREAERLLLHYGLLAHN